MNADPAAQLLLLDLQLLDTGLAQLAHRRRTLPELAVIVDADDRLAALVGDVVRAETAVADLDRAERRLESDVEQVRQRADRDQQRMQAGGLPAKELTSLQHEVESLHRRQSELEDSVLELMEQREESESALTKLRSELDRIGLERDAALAARDTAYAQIDADVVDRTARRAQLARTIPADLLTLYEKIRESAGGVGAAALHQRRCEGCRLELAGSELRATRSAPPNEVLRCENCRRILVRTPESGL